MRVRERSLHFPPAIPRNATFPAETSPRPRPPEFLPAHARLRALIFLPAPCPSRPLERERVVAPTRPARAALRVRGRLRAGGASRAHSAVGGGRLFVVQAEEGGRLWGRRCGVQTRRGQGAVSWHRLRESRDLGHFSPKG